jgi:predicted MFS family arabinose efflux permease
MPIRRVIGWKEASSRPAPGWSSSARGATLMLLAAAPSLVVLALIMVCLGIPLSPWLGSLSASVQRAVPAAAATEAFAWTFAVITVGMAAGSSISGVIIQTADTAAAFAPAGTLSLAGALFGALRLARRTSLSAPTRSE